MDFADIQNRKVRKQVYQKKINIILTISIATTYTLFAKGSVINNDQLPFNTMFRSPTWLSLHISSIDSYLSIPNYIQTFPQCIYCITSSD